jgi:hypothetical protein
MKAEPGQKKCADYADFMVAGKKTRHGIITHYAVHALANADTVEDWVRQYNALSDADVTAKRLHPDRALPVVPLGDPKQKLFAGPGAGR